MLQHALRAPRKINSEGPYVRNNLYRFRGQFLCFYCPRTFRTESARTRHILLSENCRLADEAHGLSHLIGDPRLAIVNEPEPKPHDAPPPKSSCEIPAASPDGELPRCQPPAEPAPLTSPSLLGDSAPRLEYDAIRRVYVERFPDPRAGAPINNRVAKPLDLDTYMKRAGNFGKPYYFETADLLLTTGLTNEGRDAHLHSRLYVGQTPWVNNKQLMADLDKLPHGPEWKVYNIKLDEPVRRTRRKHHSYLFKRSVVATFQDLIANPEFKDSMQYAPRREWTAEDKKCRVFGQSYSGNWWWQLQESMDDKSATIVPLIISHDRTSLSTMSGGQTAYPLYMTLANIDKSVRRKLKSGASALLAYLPVDKYTYVANKLERSRLRRELVHRALEEVFKELRVVSETGIVVLCADGRYRKAYPVIRGVMLDFEEQLQMSGVMKNRCPKCLQDVEGRGSGQLGPPRTNSQTLCALHAWLEGEGRGQADQLGLRDRPVWPWWANIPHFDFAASLMPDLLHQLHQGMLRHLLNWSIAAAGEEMVDLYFMLMPVAEGMRHFSQGVSKLQQWTGRESKEAAKQLLPIIANLNAKLWDQDFVRLARALLDFIYQAQASRMTEDEVVQIEKTLEEIHKYKGVLIKLKVFQDDSRFDAIAKLHMIGHMPADTREMGTPDGFSTEAPEHQHIESKRAWRASNKVRPTPQMIIFLQRHEALRIHRARMNAYLGYSASESKKQRRWRVVLGEDEDAPFHPSQELAGGHRATGQSGIGGSNGGENGESSSNGNSVNMGGYEEWDDDEDEDQDQEHFPGRMRTAADARQHMAYPNPTLSIARKPTVGRVRGINIIAKYGAVDFVPALHAYLNVHGSRRLPPDFLPTAYHEYPVWHRLYLRHEALPFDPEWPRRDVIRARPESQDQGSAFDTAIYLHDSEQFGIHRYRAGRVRAIFSLPPSFHYLYPHPLVYVELFRPFSVSISPHHRMHSLSQLRDSDGTRRAAVLSIFDLAAACHLAPQFKRLDPELHLRSLPDLLAHSQYFWLNHYYNRYIYRLIQHWRTARQG
ncbi:hypothetical protein FRC08_003218 [Ceratobasidium sp. 394]|nr:hypothetical protein FRC08_003218 [Ceratobasidium sp. 394]